MPVCEPSLTDYLRTRESHWMQAMPASIQSDQPGWESQIRVSDFERLRGCALQLTKKDAKPEDTLIRGRFFNQELSPGLKLQCSNTREELAFTSAATHGAGLSCIFFLSGDVGVKIGDHQLGFKPSSDINISAAGFYKQADAPFLRITGQPQYVRHLVVSASPEWITANGFEDALSKTLDRKETKDKIAVQRWTPTEYLSRAIAEVFRPPVFVPELVDLHLQARGLDIVTATINQMLQTNPLVPVNTNLSRHEKARLSRAKEMINQQFGSPLNVDLIAKESGISPSGLQRLFHKAEGMSVFAYLRTVRLTQANKALSQRNMSVDEASTMAGYTNPANFATAFKKQYGIPPSQVKP